MPTRVVVSWSGGKDSALMLDRLLRDERYDVVALATTVDETSGHVTAHGISVELVRCQSDALSIPLVIVPLPPRTVERNLSRTFSANALTGALDATVIAFGDIFSRTFGCARAIVCNDGRDVTFSTVGRRFARAGRGASFSRILSGSLLRERRASRQKLPRPSL